MLAIGGIPIYITVPWLFFAAFVVWATYANLSTTGLTSQNAIAWAVVNAVLFYGSIVVHELAHAAVARAFDLPVHGITLVFWGGYTETHGTERGPLASFLIAGAGPFSTLVLAGLFWAATQATDGVLAVLLENLALLSFLFAGLNALPGFPVDGGRMLLAVVWGITRDRYVALRVAGWGGIAVGAALGAWALQQLRQQDTDWIFFAFIGWMMISQGVQVQRQVPLLTELSRGRVAEAMRPSPDPIPDHVSLLHALETHLREDRRSVFPVVDEAGRVVGTLSFATAAKIGGNDPTRGVRDAMTPRRSVRIVPPDLPLDRALEWIAGGEQALVLDGDRLAGVLSARDVDRWYARRLHGIAQPEDTGPVPPRPDVPDRGVGGGG